MSEIAWKYAIGDVTQLFNLYDQLAPKQADEMREMVRRETKRSLEEVISEDWEFPRDNCAPKCFLSLPVIPLPVEPEESWVQPAASGAPGPPPR